MGTVSNRFHVYNEIGFLGRVRLSPLGMSATIWHIVPDEIGN
jgi:hypothetical protein